MLKNQDPVFELFRRLSKSERRNLTLFAQNGSGRKHTQTLELLECFVLAEPSEGKLLNELIQEKGLEKGLPRIKNRLKELIYASQRSLYSGKSLSSRMGNYLVDIEILLGMGLAELARKRLRKAKKLALDFERETDFLQLLDLEQRIFVAQPQEDETTFLNRIEQEEKDCLERLNRQRKLLRIHENLLSLSRRYSSWPRSEQKKALNQLSQNPVLKNTPPQSNFFSFVLHQKISGIIEMERENFRKAWEIYHPLIHFWGNFPNKIPEFPDLYLGTLNNYLFVCYSSPPHFKYFLSGLQHLRGLQGLPHEVELKFQRIANFQEVGYHLNSSFYPEGHQFMETLGPWLSQHEKALGPSRVIRFSHNIMMFYFLHGRWATAHRWLLKILHIKADQGEDLQHFARVFQLILHFELGNPDLQEYLLRSAKRFLKGQEGLAQLEECLVNFMQQAHKSGLPADQLSGEIYTQLDQDLKNIRQRLPDHRIPGLQELTLWLQCKQKGVPMRDFYAGIITNNLKEMSEKGFE